MAGVGGVRRPASVGATGTQQNANGVAEPWVPVRGHIDEVLEPSQDVEVPLGQLRKRVLPRIASRPVRWDLYS